MYKLSKTSRSRIEGIEPVLIDIIETAIKDSPFDFGIPKFGGMRTDEEQEEMFAQGRTKPGRIVTWTLNSYHKSGKAFDIYAYVGGAKWDMKYLEPIARHLQKVALEQFSVELEWGFDLWGKDGAHFQVK